MRRSGRLGAVASQSEVAGGEGGGDDGGGDEDQEDEAPRTPPLQCSLSVQSEAFVLLCRVGGLRDRIAAASNVNLRG